MTELLDSTCYVAGPNGDRRPALQPRPLLQSLPDLSVRFAVASLTASGGLTFGPAKVTAAGSTYRAVLDYVNVDAVPIDFYVRKLVRTGTGELRSVGLLEPLPANAVVVRYEANVHEAPQQSLLRVLPIDSAQKARSDQITVPVYVGVGMRLSADIRALKSGATLTSLAAIAAEAQADALSGTLTVQTLGIAGKSIATALPLPSKLDQTTVENGILALGASRAVLYADTGRANVSIAPRIVGLYSPVGTDPALINVLYSELSRARPAFTRVCDRSNAP